LVVHCVPFGNLRPVVGIALQEARADGLGAAWVVARAAGAASAPGSWRLRGARHRRRYRWPQSVAGVGGPVAVGSELWRFLPPRVPRHCWARL